ncbi:MAG TPA: PAS domain-containing protein, partial [Anaeromyxobacteraceae bacterium]
MDRRALDAAPLPTVVLRDGRIVYLNRAAAALAGRPAGEVEGEGYQQFLPAEEVARLSERLKRRLRGETVPAEYEADLVLEGRRRHVQIHVAVEEADVVVQLVDVSDRVAQREQLMELARLGARAQRERSDEAIFA